MGDISLKCSSSQSLCLLVFSPQLPHRRALELEPHALIQHLICYALVQQEHHVLLVLVDPFSVNTVIVSLILCSATEILVCVVLESVNSWLELLQNLYSSNNHNYNNHHYINHNRHNYNHNSHNYHHHNHNSSTNKCLHNNCRNCLCLSIHIHGSNL